MTRQVRLSRCSAIAWLLLSCAPPALLAGVPHAQSATRGLTGLTTPGGQSVELYDESHALVIGMVHYRNGWRSLPGVERDLVAIDEALRKHGFTVRLERDLTREAFDRVIREFIAAHAIAAGNRIIIYFAGHGFTQQASDGRQLGFIVPVDAPLPTRDDAGFRAAAISLVQMEVYAREIESRHALMVFDSCFSGSLFDVTRAGAPPAVSANIALPARQFITSGTAGQEVPDNSEFRRQFIAALEGEADLTKDGYISATELGLYLEAKVAWYTKEAQTPRFGKLRDARLDKGDMVFVSPRGPDARGAGASTDAPVIVPTQPSAARDDLTYWESVKDSRDRRSLEEFLTLFPESRFRNIADRRLEDLDREDAATTTLRFIDSLESRDVSRAYAVAADVGRRLVSEAAFRASVQELLKLPAEGDRAVAYDERSADGSAAMLVVRRGDLYHRVSLLREGSRWGVVNHRFYPRSVAVPAQESPFRDLAVEFLDLINAGQGPTSYRRLTRGVQALIPATQWAQPGDPYVQLGRPRSRTLVFVEQEAPNSAFVIFLSRFATAAVFERVSFALEDGRWMVSGLWFTPAVGP
jgi:hypothetical protein